MAATKNKTSDSTPVNGSLSAFLKEAGTSDVKPYRLDIGKGRRITFKSPDEIGTQEYLTVFGGGLEGMADEAAVGFFLDATLSDEDRAAFLAENPPLRVTAAIMDDVQKHYEAQVPTPGESPASSD